MKTDEDIFPEAIFSPIEREAADWLVQRDQGFSKAQQNEFDRWYAASPQHAEIFSELEETWHMFDHGKQAAAPNRFLRIAQFALPLAAALALGVFVWWTPVSRQKDFTEVAMTEIGQLQNLKLPDGSTLLLNSDSAVKVHYISDERRVKLLRGEVHFSVAKNPSRPFIAEIGSVAVRAVGTAFDIRLRQDEIEVLVTEGNVRVDDTLRGESLLPESTSTEPPLLNSGERMLIPIPMNDLAGAPRRMMVTIDKVDPREIQRLLAWQEMRLVFVAAPLSEIVEEFNRYNRHKLVISDPQLGAWRFGGNYRAREPATFVSLLKKSFSIVTEERENETILRQAPE